jgi:hypothetical protein
MALDPVTAGIDLANTIANKIWPDRSAQDQAQLAAAVTLVQGQLQIDAAEATSTDRMQHWRGGLGWVCSAAYAFNFIVQPLMASVSTLLGHPVVLPPLDIGPLVTLTAGMLGLGGLHVTERIAKAA